MDRVAFPVFETVRLRLVDWPTCTSPKAMLEVESNISGCGGAVPLPESATVRVPSSGSVPEPLNDAVLLPVDPGENVTVTD